MALILSHRVLSPTPLVDNCGSESSWETRSLCPISTRTALKTILVTRLRVVSTNEETVYFVLLEASCTSSTTLLSCGHERLTFQRDLVSDGSLASWKYPPMCWFSAAAAPQPPSPRVSRKSDRVCGARAPDQQNCPRRSLGPRAPQLDGAHTHTFPRV